MYKFMRALIALPLALMLGGCAWPAAAPAATVEPAAPAPAQTDAPATDAAVADAAIDEGALSASEAAALAASGDGAVRLFAANVGKGDALVLRVGDYVCLIDTGKAWARGRVVSALAAMGADRLDAVFITHTDDDHTGGLEWLAADGGGRIAEITVGEWYAPAMYTGVKPEKHDAVKAAAARGKQVRWLQRGDEVPLGDTGAVLRVLAPASLFTDKDDNNSLVMMLESDQGRILFTGDMELPEEAELLAQRDDLKCDVLKVPNHGDDDTTSAAFAKAAGARIALISTDGDEKPGTPDPGVVQRLIAAGSRVVVTQEAGLGVLVTLKGGVATAQDVNIEVPPVEGLSIAGVDASDDRIMLKNDSAAPIGLTDFTLYSEKGGEQYVFADVGIDPGATLVIGTNTTQGDCDLRWDDKKVVNQKKADVIRLYDNFGRLVDEMDNGL